MLLAAGALALVLTGQGGLTQIADKAPAAQAKPADSGATTLNRMELQKQYAGPLKDTVIQRWRDPDTGMICYIYLPILVRHSPPMQGGLVQYGANGIGTISCQPGR